MDVLLADAENVLTYIDDVLVHSRSHEEHLKHLSAAIDKIGAANLRLNPKKCVFGSDSVEYLDHTLSGDGVRPGQDKAKAMQMAQPPRSVKELRSFCGLANYFRSYIVQFAIKAAPLFKLTRQDSDWKGEELPPEASKTFLRLREEISSRPVMAYPNATGQYHLFVDAALGDENNFGGLGAVLMQDQEGGLRKPVAYASRRLDKHERNYPVFLAEMQAAVFGMEQFHHFLITGRFALYTDHRPVCKLSSVHVKTLNRLQLKKTELHPDIKYIEGKNNIVADFLSRYHGINIHVTEVKYDKGRVNEAVAALSHKDLGASVQMIDALPFRIRVLQNTDSQLKAIKDDPAVPRSTHENPAVGKWAHCKIPATVIDDILYVRALLRKGHIIRKDLRIAVPSAMRKEIMTEAHNSWIGGHGGMFKTTERLRGEFWWPGMDADIGSHVATCITCQAATNKNKMNPPP
jgi:hypothetical protein